LATRPEQGWTRRSASELTGLAASVVFATEDTTLTEAVRVAGTRWTIESCVEAAKNEVGLDHDEVRSWTGVSASHAGDVGLSPAGSVRGLGSRGRGPPKNPWFLQGPRSLTAFKTGRGLWLP